MEGKYAAPQRRRKRKRLPNLLPFIVVLLLAIALIVALKSCVGNNGNEIQDETQTEQTTVPTETTEPPITKVSTATVSATGDLLMHLPIINGCKTDDGYNFDSIFTYLKSYAEKADYAVANLETTLYGTGKPYHGYPAFNCPDEIVDSAVNAGFDMLLTANNHANDTGRDGMMRTLEVIDGKGIDRLGIVYEETEKKYTVKEINGIKIGMVCYTYETDNEPNSVKLNGIPLNSETRNKVCAFSYGELDTFYENVTANMADMKAEGAEATIIFIHWGDEYRLTANDYQKKIAQKLCDIGFDAIIGGHPHVVEPVDLLTSTSDETHKTVCLYSMGNAVSNQRIANMNLKTGNTEDGVLFSVTFAKYSDGTVRLEDAQCLPTWVNMTTEGGLKKYQILPLDSTVEDWQTKLNISESVLKNCKDSYDRTQAIVGDGMEEVTFYLNALPEVA